jgi:hypothetical protein
MGGGWVCFGDPVAIVLVSMLTLFALQRSEQVEMVRVVPMTGLKVLAVELGLSEIECIESHV